MLYRESEEMYLETILLLKNNNQNVRSIDVAKELNYSRASVSRAINLLKNRNYIVVEDGIINFTEHGYKRASEIYERHSIIMSLLVKLGASHELAEENACRIEHVISPEILDLFKKYLEMN
jgi:Mn-dependent DtxR family transcriptional regulator